MLGSFRFYCRPTVPQPDLHTCSGFSGNKKQISSSVTVSGLISLVASRRSDATHSCVFVCVLLLQTGMGRMGQLGVVGRVVNMFLGLFFSFSFLGCKSLHLERSILGAVHVFILGSCL